MEMSGIIITPLEEFARLHGSAFDYASTALCNFLCGHKLFEVGALHLFVLYKP